MSDQTVVDRKVVDAAGGYAKVRHFVWSAISFVITLPILHFTWSIFHKREFGETSGDFWMWCVLAAGAISYLIAARVQGEMNEAMNRRLAKADATEKATVDADLEKRRAEWYAKPPLERPYHGLHCGWSRGLLYSRDHRFGLSAREPAHLDAEDTFKNIVVFGSIGSGKTTRAINPLLKQILEMNTGALIFDIKTDFFQEVEALCKLTGRSYKVVGDGGIPLNLIGGCTPDLAASFLESCFSAKGQGGGDNQFFVQSAVDLCRNCFQLMELTDAEYTLRNLNRVIFSDDDRNALLTEMVEKFTRHEYDEEQEIAVEMVQQFFTKNWADHDEKVAKSIRSTVSSVLSPLQSPGLVRAFSPTNGKPEADLPAMINAGEVFLVNIPRTKYGDGGSRYAYMLLKLGFMNMMRGRTARSDWNQTRPVAFVCDEYQSIIDPISDVDFWDKSRSTKTIGLVSMQGVSSMIQALGKDTTANAILQNFRQKLIFRTEDSATYGMVQGLLGQVDVVTINQSEGYSSGVSHPKGFGGYQDPTKVSVNEGWNQGTSESRTRQELFGANDMRNLTADQVLFIGNKGGEALDEVLDVAPLYLKG